MFKSKTKGVFLSKNNHPIVEMSESIYVPLAYKEGKDNHQEHVNSNSPKKGTRSFVGAVAAQGRNPGSCLIIAEKTWLAEKYFIL